MDAEWISVMMPNERVLSCQLVDVVSYSYSDVTIIYCNDTLIYCYIYTLPDKGLGTPFLAMSF